MLECMMEFCLCATNAREYVLSIALCEGTIGTDSLRSRHDIVLSESLECV